MMSTSPCGGSKGKEDKAFAWFVKDGNGDLIKHTITVKLPRGFPKTVTRIKRSLAKFNATLPDAEAAGLLEAGVAIHASNTGLYDSLTESAEAVKSENKTLRDQIQAPALEGAFLAAYFVAGAVSLPLWVRAVARWGLVRTWAAGMALAVVTFVGALALGAGDTGGFFAVCLASGLALGADLVVPGALLAGIVRRSGQGGAAEGAFFGWRNSATKLNLALAAGLALPALQWAGYTPGSRDADALWSLSLAYAALPCGLKLLALGALWRLRRGLEGETP